MVLAPHTESVSVSSKFHEGPSANLSPKTLDSAPS
jgi:hypothetical protein